jgi:hypothetical protein
MRNATRCPKARISRILPGVTADTPALVCSLFAPSERRRRYRARTIECHFLFAGEKVGWASSKFIESERFYVSVSAPYNDQ